jgi:O-antigen/teichoic acid export membrane protein
MQPKWIDRFLFAMQRDRLIKLGKAFSISTLNQVIGSGANFILGLYLVRSLSSTELGLYGIGFAVCILYAGIGNALFLTPMVVQTPSKPEFDREDYAGRVLSLALTFCLLTVVFLAIYMVIIYWLSSGYNEFSGFLCSVGFACTGYLIRDFFIRYAFTARNEYWAVITNTFFALSLAAEIWVLQAMSIPLSAKSAMWIFGSSMYAGAVSAYLISRVPIGKKFREFAHQESLALWQDGRWALLGVFVIWMQSQAFVYVTALFLNVEELGRANAARIMITPILFALTAFNQIALPRIAVLREKNPGRVRSVAMLITLGMIIIGLVYTAIIAIFDNTLIPLVVGTKHSDLDFLVSIWCLVLLAQLARDGASTVLVAMRQFKFITLANSFTMPLSLVAALFLMSKWSIAGVVFGSVLGECALAVLLWRKVILITRK